MIAAEDKLMVVEALIEELRPFRSQAGTLEHERLQGLKAIAKDIRASLGGAASRTLKELEFQVSTAERNRVDGRVPEKNLRGVASALLGHWPVVRHALETVKEEA
jgi:hypothetical protein